MTKLTSCRRRHQRMTLSRSKWTICLLRTHSLTPSHSQQVVLSTRTPQGLWTLEEEEAFCVSGYPRGQGQPPGCRLNSKKDSWHLPDARAVGHDGMGNQSACGADAVHPIFSHEGLGRHNCRGIANVIGLPLLMGLLPWPHLQYHWSRNPLISSPVFAKTMSQDSFDTLHSHIHFSDREDPQATWC